MDRGLKWLIAPLLTFAGPTLACPPPIPGQTESQRLKPAFDATTDIAYGMVIKGAGDDKKARFEVIHVYKGGLVAGQVIEAVPSYGFDPLPCLDFPYPPKVAKGQYGVIGFRHSPALNFIEQPALQLAFEQGWIRSAKP